MLNKDDYYSLPELVKQPWFPVKSVITLRKMIDNGDIKAIDFGQGTRKWRKISKISVAEYMNNLH